MRQDGMTGKRARRHDDSVDVSNAYFLVARRAGLRSMVFAQRRPRIQDLFLFGRVSAMLRVVGSAGGPCVPFAHLADASE